MLRKSLAFAVLAALSAPALAQQQDDAESLARGAEMAARWCSHCHVVDEAVLGTDAVPPLATVAAERDAEWLRTFLAAPHGGMPDISLSSEEIDDLTRYLESLRE